MRHDGDERDHFFPGSPTALGSPEGVRLDSGDAAFYVRDSLVATRRVGPIRSDFRHPWLAIIDCSIDVGTRKAVVVLRVSVSVLHRKFGAIGPKVSNRWNGTPVRDALVEIFSQAGMPRAIIEDGGTDLNKGVELCRETQSAKKARVIGEDGHSAANALTAEFSKRSAFARFMDTSRARARLESGGRIWPGYRLRKSGPKGDFRESLKWLNGLKSSST